MDKWGRGCYGFGHGRNCTQSGGRKALPERSRRRASGAPV
ncbi:uncharacterized protein AruCF_1254 [Achromobacter ruhlandii]|nr:uncharacterized protein AruCF_1254 [Achromobacter ruhlandii]